MRIHFAHHGESEANLLHEHSNRGFKHPLTAQGRTQAVALAEALEGTRVERIYSSPLMRAVQTAEILSEALGVPYETLDALREYDCGILEGRSDEDVWRLHRAVHDDWIHSGHWERRIEGGESYLEIRDRFVPFIEHLIETYQDTPASIVLVGHTGLYRCMLPLVLANADFDFVDKHTRSYTYHIIAEPRPGGLVWTEWRDEL
jgi:broad specificity phosphatase PhoE